MSCGKHRCMVVCCNAQEHVCTRTCNGLLNCRQHRCDRVCHPRSCLMCYEASRCKYIIFNHYYVYVTYVIMKQLTISKNIRIQLFFMILL